MVNIVVNMQVGRCKHKHIIKSFNLCVVVLRGESEGPRDGIKDRKENKRKEEARRAMQGQV